MEYTAEKQEADKNFLMGAHYGKERMRAEIVKALTDKKGFGDCLTSDLQKYMERTIAQVKA